MCFTFRQMEEKFRVAKKDDTSTNKRNVISIAIHT